MENYKGTSGNRPETIVNLILAILMSSRSTKRYRSILRDLEQRNIHEGTLRVSLSRLRAKDYIRHSKEGWKITKGGEYYLSSRYRLSYFSSPFTKTSPANIIISFDIPEREKALRNWLRNQIKIFGYKKLQKSLWLGPGPLPKDFLHRLQELNIKEKVKVFKISNLK